MDEINSVRPGTWINVRHELPKALPANSSEPVLVAYAIDVSPYPTEAESDAGKVRYVTRYRRVVAQLHAKIGGAVPGVETSYDWFPLGSPSRLENVAFWAPIMAGPAELVLIGQEARKQHWLDKGPHHVQSSDSIRLAVWFGAMPESNGKTNWTVMLHREGQSLFDGETIARSEFKERMRYTADCLRFLLGDIEKEPNVLDYDGDVMDPIAANPRWMGDQEVLRRLQAGLECAEKLYEGCGAESEEEGWCVRLKVNLERIKREIERRFESAKGWAEDYPQSVAQPAKIDWGSLEIDLPDVDDMAHSAAQEALSFGLSHDVIKRHMDAVAKKTEQAVKAALIAAGHLQPIVDASHTKSN